MEEVCRLQMAVALHYLPSLHNSTSDGQPTEPRIHVMIIILIISLFAVSFPGVSKTIPFIRIPHIFFFVGKHFGTGVILATAFIHLLQDSFEALQRHQVKEHFNNIGKHTGLIILASLLSIFLIEYLSTSYVEHLHAEPSLPPTPSSSRPASPERSPQSTFKSSQPPVLVSSVGITSSQATPSQQGELQVHQLPTTDETTPLLRPPRAQSTPNPPVPHAHSHAHHVYLPTLVTQDAAGVVPIEVLTNSPRIIKMRGCTCVVGHACVCPGSTHPHTPVSKDSVVQDRSRSRSGLGTSRAIVSEPASPTLNLIDSDRERVGQDRSRDRRGEEKPRIGRRRQVIGLLVLQLGIMIHSIVIGLTLAITTGADFTSLTTAVVFHQLFEGLSLGIRIAALPPPPSSDDPTDEESLNVLRAKPRSDARRGFFKSLVMAIGGERGEGWLKSTLAILFAITTPAGMGIGMVGFKVGEKKEGIELARMYLTQGLMSAISAGMLIYASTVEMIAGDFVFGDIEGHSHLDHGHSHDLSSLKNEEHPSPAIRTNNRSRSRQNDEDVIEEGVENEETMIDQTDDELDGDDDGQYQHHHHQHHHHHHRHGKIGKKVLAVLSLLAGVGGMVLIGLGE